MRVHLKDARLCFARNLFIKGKPKTASADAKEKYQGEFIIEPGSENYRLMEAAIRAEAAREWPDKPEETLKIVKAQGNLWVLRDGDLRDRDEYKGKLVVHAKNEIRPLVIDQNQAPISYEEGRIYSGCYVNVILDVKAGSQPKKQMYAYLLGVQLSKDGERLGAGVVAAADDFDPIPEAKTATAAKSGAAALF